jgi:hypothetical protein
VKKFLAAAAVVALALPALAQNAKIMGTAPAGKTINDYYKQSVYDPAKNKIGKVDDMVMNESGQVTALIIDVGGVAGIGSKDVAVSFSAVQASMKDGEWYLTLNASKDELKSAPGLTYDKSKTGWVLTK